MSTRRWDAEGAADEVSAALTDIEESRREAGKTTAVRGYAVHASPSGVVCVAVVMSDGSVERVLLTAQTLALQ